MRAYDWTGWLDHAERDVRAAGLSSDELAERLAAIDQARACPDLKVHDAKFRFGECPACYTSNMFGTVYATTKKEYESAQRLRDSR